MDFFCLGCFSLCNQKAGFSKDTSPPGQDAGSRRAASPCGLQRWRQQLLREGRRGLLGPRTRGCTHDPFPEPLPRRAWRTPWMPTHRSQVTEWPGVGFGAPSRVTPPPPRSRGSRRCAERVCVYSFLPSPMQAGTLIFAAPGLELRRGEVTVALQPR